MEGGEEELGVVAISSALKRRLRQEECCELKPRVVGRMNLSQRKEREVGVKKGKERKRG